LFKKDLKGEVRGVNEDTENFSSNYQKSLSTLDRHRGPEAKKDLAKKIGQRRKKKEELSRLVQHYKDMKRGVAEGKTWKDFKRTIDTVRGKKTEMPKPKRADDAGARARRALKRKEYQAKVSVIVPPELEEGAAWTKKSGKNPSGGLNEKGRKSYERDNPGSDLKAPSKKVGNKRRSSFCARMKGMKKKLTSAKTANDPDSRINKSLRAWNC